MGTKKYHDIIQKSKIRLKPETIGIMKHKRLIIIFLLIAALVLLAVIHPTKVASQDVSHITAEAQVALEEKNTISTKYSRERVRKLSTSLPRLICRSLRLVKDSKNEVVQDRKLQ